MYANFVINADLLGGLSGEEGSMGGKGKHGSVSPITVSRFANGT